LILKSNQTQPKQPKQTKQTHTHTHAHTYALTRTRTPTHYNTSMSSFSQYKFIDGDAAHLGAFIGKKGANLQRLTQRTRCRFAIESRKGVTITGQSSEMCDVALQLVVEQFNNLRNPPMFSTVIQIGKITRSFYHAELCTLVRGTRVSYDEYTGNLTVKSRSQELAESTFPTKLDALMAEIKLEREAAQQRIADEERDIEDAKKAKERDERDMERRVAEKKEKNKTRNAKKRANKKRSKEAKEAEAKATEAEAKATEAEAKATEAEAKATEAKAAKAEAEAQEAEAQAMGVKAASRAATKTPTGWNKIVSKKTEAVATTATASTATALSKKRKRQQRASQSMSLKEWV